MVAIQGLKSSLSLRSTGAALSNSMDTPAAVQPHEGYNTRFDYLILAGDNGSAKGPSFRFTNVNYADLHLSDDAPDTFGVGLNIHVKAKVLEYDSSTTWFELEPVEISMR